MKIVEGGWIVRCYNCNANLHIEQSDLWIFPNYCEVFAEHRGEWHFDLNFTCISCGCKHSVGNQLPMRLEFRERMVAEYKAKHHARLYGKKTVFVDGERI